MSYSRGEVYIIGLIDTDLLQCLGCKLGDGKEYVNLSSEDMLQHMREHQAAGHLVSYDGMKRLENELRGHECYDELIQEHNDNENASIGIYECRECNRITVDIYDTKRWEDEMRIFIESDGSVVVQKADYFMRKD